MNTWIVVIVIAVCTAAIIAHNEWRYRKIVAWIDAIGEMISDFIESQK